MEYGDFTLEDLELKFGTKSQKQSLFNQIKKVVPSQRLVDALLDAKELDLRTEKAKSEAIVFPVLMELRQLSNKFITIYSGENLNVDVKAGLKGECDFIIAKDINSISINYPILQVVEAKKNDFDLGIPQCAAQMIGAMKFNALRDVHLPFIYGCVTTGEFWQFLKLEQDILYADMQKFQLKDIEILLGAFQQIIDYYKDLLA
jgi:hypothetical protein